MSTPQSDDGHRRTRRWMAFGLFLLLLALIAAGFALQLAHGSAMSGQEAERLIRSWGATGVAASLALMVGHAFVPFPAEFVAIANGMVFGVLLGTAITWVGAMLGAALSFGLARRLGQPFVDSLAPAGSCDRIREWTRSRGTVALLAVRLVPVVSFNLVNMVAGVAGVGWLTFLWTTALGILPMTSMMVLAGAGILVPEAWPAVGAGVAVLLAGLAWIGRIRSRGARRAPRTRQ